MYYKVVNRNMSSAFVGSNTHFSVKELTVYYELNKWVLPNHPGSKLMVFDCLNRAFEFKNEWGWGDYIYECEVKNPNKKGLFLKGDCSLYSKFLKVLNLKNKKKKYTHLINDPISNTVFCDAVMLTKRVYNV